MKSLTQAQHSYNLTSKSQTACRPVIIELQDYMYSIQAERHLSTLAGPLNQFLCKLSKQQRPLRFWSYALCMHEGNAGRHVINQQYYSASIL